MAQTIVHVLLLLVQIAGGVSLVAVIAFFVMIKRGYSFDFHGFRHALTLDEIKEIVREYGSDDSVVFSNPSFESAFVGVSIDGRAVYHWNKMVEYLIEEMEMTHIEAISYLEETTLRNLPYQGDLAPIVVYTKE